MPPQNSSGDSVDGTKALSTEPPFPARSPLPAGSRVPPPRYSADKRPVKGFLLGNRALDPGEGTALRHERTGLGEGGVRRRSDPDRRSVAGVGAGANAAVGVCV
jgi:hypothetical protein